jgi:hypothetical protein
MHFRTRPRENTLIKRRLALDQQGRTFLGNAFLRTPKNAKYRDRNAN